MNVQHDLERRIADYYTTEAPPRAPDWVLESTLSTIESTRQRRVLVTVPWRLNRMNGFAKLAVAAVIVVAAGIAGLAVLRPGSAPGPGGPPPTESPTPTPSPTPSPPPTPSPYVPAELTETFTSDIHGISLSYPSGWDTQAATEPWTSGEPVFYLNPAADFMWDPMKTDHLFLAVASSALGGTSFEEWADGILTAEGCGATRAPVVVDQADGLLVAECGMAFVESGDRGYMIWLYMSGDDADLRAFDYRPFFDEILATVRLNPEAAVDAAPSSSP